MEYDKKQLLENIATAKRRLEQLETFVKFNPYEIKHALFNCSSIPSLLYKRCQKEVQTK